jgi:DNA-binding response OmpR family regulator
MNQIMQRILIIDDDPDFTSIVSTILETKDYTVLVASDPKEGFAIAREQKPDLILLDVIFYGDTLGFEYCRKLKKDPETAAIPVVMVTSVGDVYGVDFWPADPDMLPADDFISKPVRKVDLLARVEKIISERKPGGGA